MLLKTGRVKIDETIQRVQHDTHEGIIITNHFDMTALHFAISLNNLAVVEV